MKLSIKICDSLDTSGPPSVPRRGSARGGASVASLRTPQNKHTSFHRKIHRLPGSALSYPLPASKAAAREPR